VSPTRRRRAVEHLQRVFGVSQRWASQLVGQHRSPSVTSPSSLTGTGPCEPSCAAQLELPAVVDTLAMRQVLVMGAAARS
jgi:hypothetical protein